MRNKRHVLGLFCFIFILLPITSIFVIVPIILANKYPWLSPYGMWIGVMMGLLVYKLLRSKLDKYLYSLVDEDDPTA